ncbi:MAG: hypothetical protein H0X24_18655 [Ktedonobacterales bacterium]|nr:hypothetical protein [Ktedonobacterales bacterium]
MQPHMDPQPPYSPAPSDEPLMAHPIPQFGNGVDPAPAEPPKRRNPFAAITALVLAIALIGGFGTTLYLHSHAAPHPVDGDPAQAVRILNHVGQSNLRDTSFTLTGTSNIAFVLQGKPQTTSTTLNGTGVITKSPARVHITLRSSVVGLGVGGSEIEEIIDENAVYLKEPFLTKDVTKPWLKLDVKGMAGSTSGLTGSNYLDFSQLQQQQVIGEDIINGKKAWHVHATLGSILASATPGVSATFTAIAQNLNANITYSEDIWIFEDSYYPAKISLAESANFASAISTATPNPTGASSFRIDETVQFTGWNTGVTIPLPPPSEISSGFGNP